jgi:cytochrome P450
MTSARTALFDPFAEGFLDDPYPHYARVREAERVHFSPLLGQWLLTGYDEIQQMLRDPRIGRGSSTRFFGNFEPDTPVDLFSREWIFGMDPPDHQRLRRLLGQAFTPRVISTLRPFVEERVTALLDQARGRGGMDVIADFAYGLPAAVICRMLGVPQDAWDECQRYSAQALPLVDPVITPAQLALANESAAWFMDFFGALVASRRRSPGDDLLSAFCQASYHGDRLSDEELVQNAIFLFVAGHETTTHLIGNGLYALLTHPAQHRALRERPDLVDGAVEEMLRYDSPVQYVGRVALAGTRIGKQPIAAGERVIGVLGAGNRDPKRFGEPDDFDVARPDCQPLSFGHGIHFCIGSALARMEAQTAFRYLIERTGDLRVAAVRRRPLFAMRGFESFDVELGGRA